MLRRRAAVVACAALIAASCSGSDPEVDDAADSSAGVADDGVAIAGEASNDPVDVAALVDLLPAETRGVFVLSIADALAGDSASAVTSVLDGEPTDTPFVHVIGEIGALTSSLDRRLLVDVMLVELTDPAAGRVVVAGVTETDLAMLAPDLAAESGRTDDATGWTVVDDSGRVIAVAPGGWVVAGPEAGVASVLTAVAAGESAMSDGPLAPYLVALEHDAHLRFAYGLPAFNTEVASDRSLRSAVVMSGGLEIAGGSIGGELAFHTANAETFVAAYNQLDRHAAGAASEPAAPVSLAPAVDGINDRVVVEFPVTPLVAGVDESLTAQNLFKKLVVGMEAHDAAENVVEGARPWFDLIVRSEGDGGSPPSPSSVFFRWEFVDDAAIAEFEQNELPEGFTLAPTRFFESDDPDGELFLMLNIYNSGGGSIVGGARAEWNVFVHAPPGGPDPDPGERPRFLVVDALAETVSFDPVNLVTPAEPVSHTLTDGVVTTSVRRLDDGVPVPVWESSYPAVDPDRNEPAAFTREMVVANDYIYWGGGAADRLLYNASVFNRDGYLVDLDDVSYVDDTRWARYLRPELLDVVSYVEPLEFVVSPLDNLDSDQLDVSAEVLEELVGFKRNGHQEGLMRKRVEELFRGVGDPVVGFEVRNDTPSATFHFEVTDEAAFARAIDLPAGHALLPVAILDGSEPAIHLTLSVFEVDGSPEGTRAEWSTTVDTGDGRPSRLVLDLLTADVAMNSSEIPHLPDAVDHRLTDGDLHTRLSSPSISFDASVSVGTGSMQALTRNWIESGDEVCRTNGVCDARFYDAETLDVPVEVPAEVRIDALSTPWDAAIDPEPVMAYIRTNAQEFGIKRWFNLDVIVDELPFGGLADATHTISGSGSLVGRETDVVDSSYTYRGDAVLDGDQLVFAIDQEISNQLGVGNIFTTGSFDLDTGTGTQTVVDCLGPALLCSDVVSGATSIYTVDALEVAADDTIGWQIDLTLVLTGGFGTADSASSFEATPNG